MRPHGQETDCTCQVREESTSRSSTCPGRRSEESHLLGTSVLHSGAGEEDKAQHDGCHLRKRNATPAQEDLGKAEGCDHHSVSGWLSPWDRFSPALAKELLSSQNDPSPILSQNGPNLQAHLGNACGGQAGTHQPTVT